MNDDNKLKSEMLQIMNELQPVAFLISISLVIAAFFANNHVDSINLKHILMASLFFFFAYIGLLFFKKTDFHLFLYFGEISILFGAISLLYSFSGIIQIISNATKGNADILSNTSSGNANILSDINTLLIFVFILSLYLISIMYFSGKVKKEKLYNWSKLFFHLSIILFCFCIFLSLLCILSGIQTSTLSIIVSIIIRLLWISISISLLPLISSYYNKLITHWMLDLSTKLKSTDTFSINPIKSLKIIVPPIISFLLVILGTWLLIDTQFTLFGIKIGLIAIIILILSFIAGFCLTWYREIIASISKT